MGKVISILGACVAVAGGAAFGLYTYTTVSCERVDPSTCPVVRAGCCHEQTECGTSAGDEVNPALAVAGPAALFATVPVNAEVSACCATKAVAKASCCAPNAACCAAGEPCCDGLIAVAGAAATAARK